jgi:hypothetical protein
VPWLAADFNRDQGRAAFIFDLRFEGRGMMHLVEILFWTTIAADLPH